MHVSRVSPIRLHTRNNRFMTMNNGGIWNGYPFINLIYFRPKNNHIQIHVRLHASEVLCTTQKKKMKKRMKKEMFIFSSSLVTLVRDPYPIVVSYSPNPKQCQTLNEDPSYILKYEIYSSFALTAPYADHIT